MHKKSGKSILIFLLALGWLGLVIVLYISESKEAETLVISEENYSTRPYTDKELKELAKEMNTHNPEVVTLLEQDFSLDTHIDTESKIQDDYSFIIEHPSSEIRTDSEVPVTLEKSDSLKSTNDTSMYLTEPIRSMCGNFFCYTAQEFLDMYDIFEQKKNLDFLTKYIYQIDEVDSYIKSKAENRGYQQRGFTDESTLVWFESHQTQPEVKKAYVAMRNEMLKEEIQLHFVSGYRSSSTQRNIFTNKMEIIDPNEIPTGVHDQKLDEVLIRSALPAYSKHHSGYAVDFGCGNDYLVYTFKDTECYAWMSTNNFENTKKHGFIPSYPEGVYNQGPNPEPWEFVWVGTESLK